MDKPTLKLPTAPKRATSGAASKSPPFPPKGQDYGLRRLNVTRHLRRIRSASQFIKRSAKFNSSPLMTHYGFLVQRGINDKVLAKKATARAYDIHQMVRQEKEGQEELTREQLEELKQVESFLKDDDFVEFMRDSVRSAPIGTLSAEWIHKMLRECGEELRQRHHNKTVELIREACTQFIDALHENHLKAALTPLFRPRTIWEIDDDWPWATRLNSVPWTGLVEKQAESLKRRLLMLHPVVYNVYRKATELFGRECLIDFETIRKIPTMKPQHLKELMVSNIRAKGQELVGTMDSFTHEIFIICPQMSEYEEEELARVLKCIKQIIVCNARQLFLNTINELVYSYENPMEALPRFILEVAIEKDNHINVYPRYPEFMFCIRKIYENAFDVVNSIPNPERFINAEVQDEATYVVDITHEFVEETRSRISNMVDKWMIVPKKLVRKLNKKYGALVNGEAQAHLEKYMHPDMNFFEALSQLSYFVEFANSCYEIPSVIYYNNILFMNEEVQLELLETANFFYFALLEYLVTRFRELNSKVIDAFEHIRSKLLKIPKTTEELMKLIEHHDYARRDLLPTLKELISEGVRQHFALLDVYILGVDELEQAAKVQTWHLAILPVFEQSVFMIEDTRERLEEYLAKCIAELRADILKLHRRIVEDFSLYGNYDQCSEYVGELKYIRDRLQALQERTDWIHNEETLFKYTNTNFTELQDVIDDVEPFEKLWKLCIRWQRAEKKYMDGDFDLNARGVDTETSELLREIYDLQELFKTRIKAKMQAEADAKRVPLSVIYNEDSETDLPPPLKVCQVALDSINKFREYVPFIRVFCNPALRPHHWYQMAKIYGDDIKPDTGSSLRKYLKMNLDEYFDRFKAISRAASKECALETGLWEPVSEE